jgi:hypothetical protein
MEQHQELTGQNGNGHSATAVQFCGGCGKRFKDQSAFCAGCGRPRPPAVSPAPRNEPEASLHPALVTVPTIALPTPPLHEPATEPLADNVAEPGRRSRRRPLIIAGAVVVAAALVGAGTVALGGGGKGYDVDASIARADQSLKSVADKLTRAEKVADIRTAAGEAEEAQDQVAKELSSAGKISDPAQRSAAREALEAEGKLLEAWHGLTNLADNAPDSWTAAAATLADPTESWEKARDRLATNGLAAMAPDLRNAVTDASEETSQYLADSAVQLGVARADADRAMADKSAGIAVIDAYSKAARQEINAYATLRKDFAAAVARIENGSATWSEAYRAVSAASDDRSSVRDSLAVLAPPTAVESAHGSLINAIEEALSAVGDAYDGLQEYQSYGGYYYDSITSTPGWQSFDAASDRITTLWGTAVSDWEKAVGDETARLNAIGTTPLPTF